MSISIGNTTSSGNKTNTTGYSFNHTCASNTKALIVVVTGADSNDSDAAVSVTYNSATVSAARTKYRVSPYQIAMFILQNPPTGSAYSVAISHGGTNTDSQATAIDLVSSNGSTIAYDTYNESTTSSNLAHILVVSSVRTGAMGIGGIVDVQANTSDLSVASTYGTEVTGSEADMGSQVVGCAYRAEASGQVEIRWNKSSNAVSYAQICTFYESSVALVVANCSQSHTVDNVSLTQHQVLAVNNTSQLQPIGAINLTQHQVLTVSNTSHLHSVDNITLTYHPKYILEVINTSHLQNTDTLNLTQHYILSINNAYQPHTSDNTDLIQNYVISVDNASHLQYADNINLVVSLRINDTRHSHTSGNVILVGAAPLYSLSDDFNDNNFNTTVWYDAAVGDEYSSYFDESNGRLNAFLHSEPLPFGSHYVYHGLDTVQGKWLLTNDEIKFKIAYINPYPLTDVDDYYYISFNIIDGLGHFYRINILDDYYSTPTIQVDKNSSSNHVYTDTNYNPDTYKYLRIRNTSGTTYLEYSPNNTTWYEMYSSSVDFTPDKTEFDFYIEGLKADFNYATVYIDAVNIDNDWSLIPDDCSHTQTVDNLTLTYHALEAVANDCSQLQTSDNITITAINPFSSFVENFNDNNLDTNIWDTFSTPVEFYNETNQRMEFYVGSTVGGGYQDPYLYTLNYHGLTGSQIKYKLDLSNLIKDISTASGYLDFYTYLNSQTDEGYFSIYIAVDSYGTKTIHIKQRTAALVTTNIYSYQPYDEINFRYIRIRENGGTVYFEKSANGSDWSGIVSTNTFNFSLSSLELMYSSNASFETLSYSYYTLDSINVENDFTISVQNCSQSQTSDNLVLESTVPAIELVISNTIHNHTSDLVSLVQHQILTVNNNSHTHSVDNIILAGVDIVVNNTLHAHTSDNITITANVPTGELVVASSAQAHTSDNVTLTQHQVLTVNSCSQLHTVDNITLTQNQLLTINNSEQLHTCDNTVLVQHQVLVVNNSTQLHTATTVDLVHHSLLIVNSCSQLQNSDTVSLYSLQLNVAFASHSQTSDNINLQLHQAVVVSNTEHLHTSGSPVLSQHLSVDVDDVSHELVSDTINLSQGLSLSIANTTHSHTIDSTQLTQHQVLATNNTYHEHTASSIFLGMKIDVANTLTNIESSVIILLAHYSISIGNVTQLQNTNLFDLVQHQVLVVNDTQELLHSDNVVLIYSLGDLSVSDSILEHYVDNLVLTAHNVLVIQPSTQDQTTTLPNLVQHHVISINNNLLLQTVMNIVLRHAITQKFPVSRYNVSKEDTSYEVEKSGDYHASSSDLYSVSTRDTDFKVTKKDKY